MAINEIRESLHVEGTHAVDLEAPLMYQRKINLSAFKKHTINYLDFFDDIQILPSGVVAGWQFYVTKYPIALTRGGSWSAFTQGGPEAADDNVLFKAQSRDVTGLASADPAIHQFPNQFLGSSPTFTFYTAHVYLTLVVYSTTEINFKDPTMSFYMAVDEKTVDSVVFGMGSISEYLNAQVLSVISNAVRIADPTKPLNFPMWQVGGIRPEYMLRANALADFWGAFGGNFSEKTLDTTNWRIYGRQASTMVGFDQAFGVEDASKGGIPDWIAMSGKAVMTSGAIRDEFPPHVVTDAGVTRMV